MDFGVVEEAQLAYVGVEEQLASEGEEEAELGCVVAEERELGCLVVAVGEVALRRGVVAEKDDKVVEETKGNSIHYY